MGEQIEVQLEHGRLLTGFFHDPSVCEGQPCTLHNRTDHHMRSWPQHWRQDRHMMERICEHNVGHPDPDDYRVRTDAGWGVHGCDGCCARRGVNDDLIAEIRSRVEPIPLEATEVEIRERWDEAMAEAITPVPVWWCHTHERPEAYIINEVCGADEPGRCDLVQCLIPTGGGDQDG